MKNRKRELREVPLDVRNQFTRIIHDPDYQAIRIEFQKLISRSITKYPNEEAIVQCKRAIKKYIQEKDLPTNWEEPLFNIIRYDEEDFPLDNGIELIVGSKILTVRHGEVLKIKNNKTGEIADKRKISIVITSKTSIERIIQFLKDFKDEITFYQEFLELPDFNNANWKQTKLAQRIIYMKDKQGLTFSAITTELSNEEWLDEKELEYRSNENNIKSLYYDYKKYLKMK